jgi:acyl dehydratase
VAVTGVLERVRERGGIGFVNFAIEARDADGPLLTAGSTFLMSGSAPPGGDAEEREEPPPTVRGPLARPQRLPAGSGEIPPLAKSASRSDLVRYAGASRDFNPIHWDHDLAVQAGLGGVVAHGLLVAAWATQPAAVLSDRPDPLASARIRFREPLHVDVPVEVRTERKDGNRLDVSVDSDAGRHVTAQIEQAV